jgi:hypothetical protein
MAKVRVNQKDFREICERLAEGESLTKICGDQHLPSWRTVLRHVQDTDHAYDQYRNARALQAEIMRDEIIDIVSAELPNDPKLAQAEVGRRRLEADYKDKMVRQLQPRGVRNREEDKVDEGPGEMIIRWQGAGISLE